MKKVRTGSVPFDETCVRGIAATDCQCLKCTTKYSKPAYKFTLTEILDQMEKGLTTSTLNNLDADTLQRNKDIYSAIQLVGDACEQIINNCLIE